MSEQQEAPEVSVEEEAPTTGTSNHHGQFQGDLKAKIAERNPEVRQMLLDDMTQEELEKRKGIVRKLMSKIDDMNKELKKAENQGTYSYNAKGEKTGDPSFTKDQVDKMKKMREEIQKHNSALAKALEQGDYTKATELTQK